MKAIRATDSDSKEAKRRFVRKVIPISPPTTVEIHGIRIHFPFRPYECQEVYMKKVIEALLRSENALLESPTGTGKTLCLLCACLAWQRQQSTQPAQLSQLNEVTADLKPSASQPLAKSKPSRVPTIIYASRTHSQLSQVVRELRSTRYRPNHAVLGSREQMCVNPKVKKANTTASDINHDCNKLGKDRRCRFRNGLEGFVAPVNEEGAGESMQPVMDMEDLVTMGKQHNVCPFYYTRSQVESAELILVPYNYLFDKDARQTTLADVPWDNAIVIFDEAHNLETFASESASFDLTSLDIAGCISEVSKAMNYLQAVPDLSYNLKEDNLLRLKAIFMKLEDYILNHLGHQNAFSGEFIFEIFKKGAHINYENHSIFIEEVRKVNDLLMDMRGSSSGRGAPKLEHFVQCLKRVFGHAMESKCYAKAAFYRVHVSPKPTGNQKQSRTISYWCFAPSLAMEELAGLNIRSILVTSGTLSPLPSYSLELGLHFAHQLENPHIISDEQIHVRIVSKGVSGKVLNSSFERRKDGEYYSELGSTLVSLAKVTPAGMLVFFPSYSVMETCIERWGGPASSRPTPGQGQAPFFAPRRRQAVNNKYSFPHTPSFFNDSHSPSTPWKRLLATKAVVVEPKSSADLPDAMAEFKRFLGLQKSSGCVLMGVCRGKISEGIDFAHEQSRAVVITGLPFPPSFDPKVKMKREFLDGSRAAATTHGRNDGGFGSLKGPSIQLSGLEWYTQQAHRAVNQAIGRVIRNMSDYGAVLLLDSRFSEIRNQEGLSMWLRPHIQKDEGFGTTIRSLAKFYKDADVKAMETASKLSVAPVLLEYEEEEGLLGPSVDDNLTKLVVVRASANPNEQGSASMEGNDNSDPISYVAPDRVIAKLDVKEMQQKRAPSPEQPARPTKKLKVSNDAVFGGNLSSVSVSVKSTASTAKGDKNIAAQFFDRAKSKLSLRELSSIKTAIVAMKETGQKKDTSGFVKAAGDVVKVIVRCDGLEGTGNSGHSSSLLLFFRLLPCTYRVDVETMAMKLTFDSSVLGQLCKENLAPGYFGMLRAQIVPLLRSVWCLEPESRVVVADYLLKVEAVLRILLNAEGTGSAVIKDAFLKLFPARYVSMTRTLANEMVAAAKIERMKATDIAKCRDSSLLEEKFVLPVWSVMAKQTASRDAGSLKAPEDTSSSGEPLSHGRGKVDQGNVSRSNPYTDKKPKKVAPEARESSLSSLTKTVEKQNPGEADVRSNLNAEKKSHEAPKARSTSLSSLFKRVESDTYVKQSCADIARNIPTNASQTITCPLCSDAATEPFIAECGHVACLNCWKVWLARSESCPSCRVSTSIESISRIIFESSPGEGAPESLSQLCNFVPASGADKRVIDDNDIDDSEGELEIC